MEAEALNFGAIVVTGAIALAAFLPALLRFAILPAVVLELLFGVLIGPQVWGLVETGELLSVFSQIGLAVLFLIAGLEINRDTVRGPPTRLAFKAWLFSLAFAVGLVGVFGWVLGLFPASGFIVIALATTAIGALMPILKNGGLLETSYGPYVLATGALGEALPLIALSLMLAGFVGFGAQSVVLVTFAILAALSIGLAERIRDLPLPPVFHDTIASSGQFPVRLALFLVITFSALGEMLGLDLVLGAFVAGAVLRTLLPHDLHDELMDRLAAVGYGFVIPIFFVTSGMALDVASLTSSPGAVSLVPLFFAMMLAARGVPTFFVFREVLSLRERFAMSFHAGTQLPLVVAISALAVEQGSIPGWCAAALVAAAVLTVIICPAVASAILRRGAKPHAP